MNARCRRDGDPSVSYIESKLLNEVHPVSQNRSIPDETLSVTATFQELENAAAVTKEVLSHQIDCRMPSNRFDSDELLRRE